MKTIESLIPNLNSILKVRDDLGAGLQPISIVKRTWTGRRAGDGEFSDVTIDVKPTPQIVELSHAFKLKEGGGVESGDIMLKGISKASFPTKAEVQGHEENELVECFYKIGPNFYTVRTVVEKYVTWDVHLRKLERDPLNG